MPVKTLLRCAAPGILLAALGLLPFLHKAYTIDDVDNATLTIPIKMNRGKSSSGNSKSSQHFAPPQDRHA